MNLFIDIETIPSQHPEALAAVRAGLKPPATLKKPESIAAWWESEADTATAETWRKQALDGGTQGEIVSIAVVSEDGQEWVRCRNLPGYGDTEAALLSDFIAVVEEWTAAEAPAWCPITRTPGLSTTIGQLRITRRLTFRSCGDAAL